MQCKLPRCTLAIFAIAASIATLVVCYRVVVGGSHTSHPLATEIEFRHADDDIDDVAMRNLVTGYETKILVNGNPRLTNAGFDKVAWASLTSLAVSHTQVTSDLFPDLLPESKLEMLDVSFTCIDDSGIKKLLPATKLTYINAGRSGVTGAALDGQSTPRLQELYLYGNRLDGTLFESLLNCKSLKRLSLRASRWTSGSLKVLGQHSSLSFVDISETEVTVDEVQEVARSPSLERLWIQSCPQLADRITDLVFGSSMRIVNLSDCNVPKSSVLQLKAKYPYIEFQQ